MSRDLTVLSSGAGFMFPVPVAPGFVLRTETIRRGAQVRVGALFEARSVTHLYRPDAGDRRDVIYVRRVWRLIMLAIRALPERVFKRMRV